MTKRLLSILFFEILVIGLFAQNRTISGRITDARSGEGIGFASIFFKGTTRGVTSDFDGNYKVVLVEKVDSITCSYIGYYSKTKPLKADANQVINFQLEPSNLELDEVVIRPGENPALRIIRNAQKNANKNDWRSLTAYQYESFTKLEVAVDNVSESFKKRRLFKDMQHLFDSINGIAGEDGKAVLPLFISETLSDFYYLRSPRKQRETIKASKVTGVGLVDGSTTVQVLGATLQQYNFYEHWNSIMDKDFISPIAPGSLSYYIFTLRDSVVVNNHKCYVIDLNPRRPQDLAYTGTIWVTDTSFALARVSLEVTKVANLNFIERLKIQQECIPSTAGNWLPQNTRVLVDVAEVKANTAGMIAKFFVSNRNFEVNHPKDLKFYDQMLVVEPDALSKGKDDAFWQEKRHEKLSNEEARVYQMVDSLKDLPVIKTYVTVADVLYNGYYNVGKLAFGSWLYLYGRNIVEGNRFRIGIKTNWKFSKHWTLKAYAAYGLKDQKWKYSGSAEYLISRKHWTYTGIVRKDDIDQTGVTDYISSSGSNAFAAASVITQLRYLNKTDEYKYYFSSEFHKDWTLNLSFQNKRYTALFPFKYENENNNLVNSFTNTIASAELRFAYKELFLVSDNERISLGTDKAPAVTIGYQRGLKGVLGGDFNYNKIYLRVEQTIITGRFGYSKYQFIASKNFGILPYTMLDIHRGNQTPVYSTTAFNLMRFFEFSSDQFVSLAFEQHFEGFFTNRVPIMRKWKWRNQAGIKAIYGSMSPASIALTPPDFRVTETLKTKPYLEINYGFENILRLVRIDFINRLTYLDLPNATPFSVKLSVQFSL